MKQGTRRIVVAGMSVVLTLGMSPLQALAATSVTVDKEYTSAASGSGSSGGTWSWNGVNDMVLENYDGGGIYAVGDLDITLSGDNAVTTGAGKNVGIGVSADSAGDGDLTIKGDGNLDVNVDSDDPAYAIGVSARGDVNIDDTTVDVDVRNEGAAFGIASLAGSVNIDNSHVSSNATASTPSGYGSYGIDAQSGDVNITDSNVTATSSMAAGMTSDETTKTGIFSFASGINSGSTSNGGNITIIGSTVNATATGMANYTRAICAEQGDIAITNSKVVAKAQTGNTVPSEDVTMGIVAFNSKDVPTGAHVSIVGSDVTATATNKVGDAIGVEAQDETGENNATILISGSNVKASATGPAILAWGPLADHLGIITITNGSSIVSPDGAKVLEIRMPPQGASLLEVFGQTIGMGDGPITWTLAKDGSCNPAIASSVEIAKPTVPAQVAETQVAETSATETFGTGASVVAAVIPRTGDGAPSPVALLALGSALVAAGATFVLRRRGAKG